MDKETRELLIKALQTDGEKDEVKPEKPEEKETAEQDTSVDAGKIASEIGDRVVQAIEKATGHKDDNTLNRLLKPEGGMQGIEYPSLDKLHSLGNEDKILTFWKALNNYRDDPEAKQVFKALVEGTDGDGGYLVPEIFRAEVFRLLPDFSVMRKIARILPMTTDTLNLNTLSAEPMGYWTSEYASKATTSAEFGRVQLQPNKLVCLLPVTQELVDDANIDIVRFILELFAEKIARLEDKAYFVGTGTGQPQGISSCSGIGTYAAGGVLNYDDMLAMIHGRNQAVRKSPNAAFVGSNRVIHLLRKVKDGNNNYIWSQGLNGDVKGGTPDRVWNYPIYEQNDIPEDQLFFGDWSKYIIGDRQQLTVMTTTEGGDAWRRDSVEIKTKIRVDGKCVLANAFVKATGIQS